MIPEYCRFSNISGGYSEFTDIMSAQAELGFGLRPLADSVRDTYRWFDEQGMLGKNG